MSYRWLSVKEIAEHLGISKDTVYTWIAKQQMPAHKVNNWVLQGTATADKAGDQQ